MTTQKATHTAGPWRVSQITRNPDLKPAQRRYYAGDAAYVWTDRPYPRGNCIAVVYEECIGEIEANAALVAAVPDLLDAAKPICEWLGAFLDRGEQLGNLDMNSISTLRAAIAKVEGN